MIIKLYNVNNNKQFMKHFIVVSSKKKIVV